MVLSKLAKQLSVWKNSSFCNELRMKNLLPEGTRAAGEGDGSRGQNGNSEQVANITFFTTITLEIEIQFGRCLFYKNQSMKRTKQICSGKASVFMNSFHYHHHRCHGLEISLFPL